MPLYYAFKKDRRWIKSSGGIKFVNYILMEHIEGCTLDVYMKKTEPNEDYLRFIVKKILKTLNILHSNGIAHRDLKLENIILT